MASPFGWRACTVAGTDRCSARAASSAFHAGDFGDLALANAPLCEGRGQQQVDRLAAAHAANVDVAEQHVCKPCSRVTTRLAAGTQGLARRQCTWTDHRATEE